ncbi:MAG: ATP-binding cassette domain-containing protein [Eubacterium sp.]|nr:ATP-binding cassette domain-containing protein [Eubacterium sp.]
MTEIICQTKDLCKNYKNVHVLENVNLSIKRGEIYGLIGENGAGKSTLIRILTGLAFKSSGGINLFGKTERLQCERAKIGCTVEMPALYKDMTAEQNLEIQRVQRGIPNKKCISKTLELVGLDNTNEKKVNNFSLGMKQRLSLAIALLGEPEFLILDEPVNGLDPTGIIELREMLKKLTKENHVTILISSHILSELNQLATCYGFLHHGKLLRQITAAQLGEECRRHIKLKTDDTKRAATIIEEYLKIKNFSIYPDNYIRIYEKLEEIHSISKTLFSNGIIVEELSIQGEDLETYFENLIGGKKNV